LAEYTVEVKNNGSAPATNVLLAVTWGLNLELFEASRAHEDELSRLTTRWRINQLAGGETITRQLNCVCQIPDEQGAVVRATVSSQQTAAVTNQIATVIVPGAAASPRRVPPPQSAAPIRPEAGSAPASPAAGNLKVTASALANPIIVGSTTTCLINITNDRNVPDQEVTLSVQTIGDGLTMRATGTPTPVAASSPAAIDFAAIRTMRPGEQLPTPYRVEVRGDKPGRHKLRITAKSSLTAGEVVSETELVVNAP